MPSQSGTSSVKFAMASSTPVRQVSGSHSTTESGEDFRLDDFEVHQVSGGYQVYSISRFSLWWYPIRSGTFHKLIGKPTFTGFVFMNLEFDSVIILLCGRHS